MKTERKTIGATIQKADEDGTFEAQIATFGVIDHDGDVVELGAFADHPVPILPAHDGQHVPMGKAVIEERGNQAVAVGQFNLEIPAARDWHSALKFDLANIQPPVQEWSWGFRVLGPEGARADQVDGQPIRRLLKVDQREISPVLRGASVGTATLMAKAEGGTGRHTSKTSTDSWQGPANQGRLPELVPLEDARHAFGWIDLEQVKDAGGRRRHCHVPKTAGRFCHHEIDEDGTVGAASVRAAVAGIAVLNGARGGSTVTGKARDDLYAHLAGHLEDADLEAPELRAEDELGGMKLTSELELVTWDVEAVLGRVADVVAARAKNGGDLGKEAKALALELGGRCSDLEGVLEQLRGMAENMLPEDRAARAAAKFLAADALRLGVKTG
ncbi:MAG: hypothetical protein GY898_23205 [Proteobacteria bacterium]|nr:hypothetical protein [Pseudomonadota bacterium]